MTTNRKEENRQRYKKRRLAGLCHNCSKPAEEGKSRCVACRVKNVKYARSVLVRKTSQIRRCVICGQVGHNSQTCGEVS